MQYQVVISVFTQSRIAFVFLLSLTYELRVKKVMSARSIKILDNGSLNKIFQKSRACMSNHSISRISVFYGFKDNIFSYSEVIVFNF